MLIVPVALEFPPSAHPSKMKDCIDLGHIHLAGNHQFGPELVKLIGLPEVAALLSQCGRYKARPHPDCSLSRGNTRRTERRVIVVRPLMETRTWKKSSPKPQVMHFPGIESIGEVFRLDREVLGLTHAHMIRTQLQRGTTKQI